MTEEKKMCPFCSSSAKAFIDYKNDTALYECSVCGRFKLSVNSAGSTFLMPDVKDMVATYLFYNGVHYCYFTSKVQKSGNWWN